MKNNNKFWLVTIVLEFFIVISFGLYVQASNKQEIQNIKFEKMLKKQAKEIKELKNEYDNNF